MTDVIHDIKEMNIGKVDEDCLMSKYTTYKVGINIKRGESDENFNQRQIRTPCYDGYSR